MTHETRAVFRHRDFALLWGGQTVSLAGNGAFQVALPLEVLRLTASPLDLALVVSTRTLTTVILLLAGGTFVDRMPRRSVMLTSDVTCGVAVSLMAFFVAIRAIRLWDLLFLSIIFGAAGAFFKPAATAIVRDILPIDLLVPASSWTSLSQSMAQSLVGPLAGGVIVAAAGTSWAFGIDGASFAVSAFCLAMMRRTPRPKPTHSRLRREITDGIRFCFSQRWLASSLGALGIANLACFSPFYIMEPLLARNAFGAGPVAVGALYAANGGGGVVAALVAARRGSPRQRMATMWLTWAAAGLFAASAGLSPWLWLTVLFAGLTVGSISYGNILWYPLIQQETPPELLGRVSSVDWLFSLALSPLGIIGAGAAVGVIGVRLTVLAGGAVAAATGSVLLIPGVTRPDRREARATA
jgi:hypothetical protein